MDLKSNAPAPWPSVAVASWDLVRSATNIEPFAEALDRAFMAANATRPILLYVPRLFRGGFLPVPLETVEKTGNVAVFPYPNASVESAGHYLAARRLLKEKGVEAVYFAPEILPDDAPPVSPLRPFDPDYLGPGEGERPRGRFGTWWTEAAEPCFSESAAFQYIDRTCNAIRGIESYVFGALLHSLRMIPTRQRIALPNEMTPIHITGPDLRDMFLSATADKGIRFRFSLDTPAWYRDTFLGLFASFVEGLAERAKREKWELDPEESRGATRWWRRFRESLPLIESSVDSLVFGILIDDARRGSREELLQGAGGNDVLDD